MDSRHMELRNKATVGEGITKDIISGGMRLVEYQPGNGTRYVLALSSLDKAQCRLLGFGEGAVLVTLTNFSEETYASYPFYRDNGYLPVHMVERGLQMRSPDACVVTELLGYLLGRETDNFGPSSET